MLWVYGELSPLEKLSCVSFARKGFHVKMWTYGDMKEPPHGIEVCDARSVLPETRIFKYSNGSYAGFSDLFRYAVLLKYGGLWADTDVICLIPENDIGGRNVPGFLVTEHRKEAGLQRLNNNVIYLPSPSKGDIIDLAFGISDRFDTTRVKWGDCGPTLLTMLARNYPAVCPPVMEPNFANPIPAKKCPKSLLKPRMKMPTGAAFLHCYNERWRRKSVDKGRPWPHGSLLATIAAECDFDS